MLNLLDGIVESLEPRRLLSASLRTVAPAALPNDPGFTQASLYGLNRIGADRAWATTTGHTAIIVASIDSGVDFAHPDLYLNIWINQGEIPATLRNSVIESPLDGDNIITFRDLNARNAQGQLINGQFVSDLNGNGYIDGEDLIFDRRWADGVDTDGNGYIDDLIGWDFANNDNDPYDYNGHGTHTAGIIGAVGNNALGVVGVNWNVQIMPIKIFSDNDVSAPDPAIAAGIYYAVNMGARISNNSYGGAFGYTGDVLYNAIDYARQRDHLFIAAAGNNGLNNDTAPMRSYPASYDLGNIISVAASDQFDRLAYFSNYGWRSVDIAAPGVGILSTINQNGYGRYSGTSMAAPHVAGAAALMLSLKPNLAAWQLRYALMLSAQETPSLRYTVFSRGRLNVAGAVEIAQGFRPAGFANSPQVKALGQTWGSRSPFAHAAHAASSPLVVLEADEEDPLLPSPSRPLV